MSDESGIELAVRLKMATARLARLLRQQSQTDLTLSQQAILATINDHGPMTPSELAAREQVAAPTITRAVARLEQAGLVTRLRDDSDRRFVNLSITAEGNARLTSARTRRNAWLALRLRELDTEQRDRLSAAVEVIERLAEAPLPPTDDDHTEGDGVSPTRTRPRPRPAELS